MADLVIRGMKMPEYCYECPCHNGESGYCQAYKSGYLYSIERPAKCPIIPIPEGHGRLIDADEFIERVRMDDRTTIIEEMHIAEILSEAPTIVPAEGDQA